MKQQEQNTLDLVSRIEKVNKLRETKNKENMQAIAEKNLLESQIKEVVGTLSSTYDIEFPKLDGNLDAFSSFVENLVAKEYEALSAEVELAERVNALVESGDIAGAKELLGYETPEEDEEDVEEVVPLKETPKTNLPTGAINMGKASKKEEVEPKKVEVVEEEDEEFNLDDLISDLPSEEVEPKSVSNSSSKSPVVATTDFDMSLSSLEEVASEKVEETPSASHTIEPSTVSSSVDSGVAEIEEEEVVPVRRRRRRVIVEDEDSSDLDIVLPTTASNSNSNSSSPLKTGGAFSFD